MKKNIFTYYEAVDPKDAYKLNGRFDSEQEALKEINASYKRALNHGYDNRHESWVVVCVQVTRCFNDAGEFLRETTDRFAVFLAQYSFYEEAYVEVH